jgi:hypothetical protein
MNLRHGKLGPAFLHNILMLGLLFSLGALTGCDPAPREVSPPPGGYSAMPNALGQAAIQAVLYTPSHGSFRTVREALTTYIGRTTEAVEIQGWSAHSAVEPIPRVLVEFSWRDRHHDHQAEWELNEFGVWPLNDEARYLSMYPPEDGRP